MAASTKQLELLRRSFREGLTKSITFRKEQIKGVFKMLVDEEEAFCEALKQDLNKSHHDTVLTEIYVIKNDISEVLRQMDKLLISNEKLGKTLLTLTDTTYVQRQPFGVVLVIGAWNYPISLTLQPLIGAIAAGNVVLLKPSEVAVNVEQLLLKLLPNYIDHRICQVFTGGAEKMTQLLKERFDFICYTGSSHVGRIIYEAAAKHLTPVLLEMGGKSPVYVDENCDLELSARRIIWGKCLNAGQTCIAPDYVLCHERVNLNDFVAHMKKVLQQFFVKEDKQIVDSMDYGRIINERHFNRIINLLKESKGTKVVGGLNDVVEKFIEPTIITNVSHDDSLMQEELFGPVLPIITIPSMDDAIKFINEREKPLALYVFTKSKDVMQAFESGTSSGALVFNAVIYHCGVVNLPFGGVGHSGIGNYHGKYSLETFSHKRACLNKDTNEIINYKVAYPPHTKAQEYWMSWVFPSAPESKKSCTIL